MADIVLFGATGFTGRLTAHALFRRGAKFALAGRNRAKLERLAAETGEPDVILASVDDPDGLVGALAGARVLITCVGPFTRLGDAAADAALKAGVHYIDSTGEGVFIDRLIKSRSERARARGVAMAPALGFDEVPADVAATLATEDMAAADLVLTYSVPSSPSSGTAKSVLDIVTNSGVWIAAGRRTEIRAGERSRWAPMPPPLGPRRAVSYPLAEGLLAPLHLDLNSLELYGTAGRGQALALKGLPVLGALLRAAPVRRTVEGAIDRFVSGPEGDARGRRWTILAEARSGDRRRNVVVTGRDPYGLTAELLAAGALHMLDDDFDASGVLAPVQAIGLDVLQKELIDHGVSIETFEA